MKIITYVYTVNQLGSSRKFNLLILNYIITQEFMQICTSNDDKNQRTKYVKTPKNNSLHLSCCCFKVLNKCF